MATYRVRYTEVKPGGTRVRQDEAIHGDLSDVRAHLGRFDVDYTDYFSVTEYTQSDSPGRPVEML